MDRDNRNCSKAASEQCADKNAGNSLLSCFFSLPPKQFSLLSSLIGILLVDNLDLSQQNSLGNFIVGIGQAILTSAAQGQLLQSSSSKDDCVRQQIQMLKKQICSLEQELESK